MRRVAAILLAGGVGSRLSILVQYRAKPAVPFGGIYRIIDFTLSSIANSGISRVAVLTQYKPLSLMGHIGDGSAWDLSGRLRGVKILPPKTGEADWDWYKGTADAVRQNIDFFKSERFTEVLIVSGDHVYCMDYAPLVAFHRERKAQVTIGMLPVPWEETRHFGIGILDGQSRLVDWEEKPVKARSNLASMGIYVFDKTYLVDILSSTKEEDFGKNIIPMAMAGKNVYAFPFNGYWRDVGTIQAYWDANMDLLKQDSGISPQENNIRTNVFDDKILYDRPPCRIGGSARVANSFVAPACSIYGNVENSLLSPGVIVEEGAEIKDSVIMHDTIIRRGARVERCIIDKDVIVGEGAAIGKGNHKIANRLHPDQVYSGLTVIGKRAAIPPGLVAGTNCIVFPAVEDKDFLKPVLADGETIEKRNS